MVRMESPPQHAWRAVGQVPQAGVAEVSYWSALSPLFNFCLTLPWENFGDTSPAPRVRSSSPPQQASPVTTLKPVLPIPPAPSPVPVAGPAAKPTPAITRPGCTAADATLFNLSYLEGLSRGLGGFGVLRVGRERLEEGVRAAHQMGQTSLAGEMHAIAQELSEVQDPAAAAVLAEKLRPVADRAWALGRRCGGHVSPQNLVKAWALARKVQEGTLTMEDTVKRVQEEE